MLEPRYGTDEIFATLFEVIAGRNDNPRCSIWPLRLYIQVSSVPTTLHGVRFPLLRDCHLLRKQGAYLQ